MILLLVVKITGGKSDMTQDTHTACSSMLYIPHMTHSEDSYPGVQLCAPSNSHTHCWYKHRTNGQMSTNQHMGLQTDLWTRGVSRHLNAPQVSQPWPLQRALKSLEDNSPLPHFVLPSHLPPSFCPDSGLCPDNQSNWWLCFRLLSTLLLFTPPLPTFKSHPPAVWVGSRNLTLRNVKDCFGKMTGTVRSYWHQIHNGPRLGRKITDSEWCLGLGYRWLLGI